MFSSRKQANFATCFQLNVTSRGQDELGGHLCEEVLAGKDTWRAEHPNGPTFLRNVKKGNGSTDHEPKSVFN